MIAWFLEKYLKMEVNDDILEGEVELSTVVELMIRELIALVLES